MRALILTLLLTPALPALAAPLPEYAVVGDPDEPWRSGLRSELSMLGVNDFMVPQSGGVACLTGGTGSHDAACIEGTPALWGGNYGSAGAVADVELGWLMHKNVRPVAELLNLPPDVYVLDYIEGLVTSPEHCLDVLYDVVVPRTDFNAAVSLATLYALDYTGNPYFQDPGTLHRAFVSLAVDMIMLDQLHKSRHNNQHEAPLRASPDSNPPGSQLYSNVANTVFFEAEDCAVPIQDPAGGTLLWSSGPGGLQPPRAGAITVLPTMVCGVNQWDLDQNRPRRLALALNQQASAYALIRDHLSQPQQAYLDQGMVRLANRLARWGVGGQFGNMITPGANALYLVAAKSGDPQALADYETFVTALYGPGGRYNTAGFFPDLGGWDASYNGYNIGHASRLHRFETDWADSLPGTTSVFPYVDRAVDNMFRLAAHTTIREPGWAYDAFYGANHFNTRTGDDQMDAQWLKASFPFNGIRSGARWAYPFLTGVDPVDSHELEYGYPSGSWHVPTRQVLAYKQSSILTWFGNNSSHGLAATNSIFQVASPSCPTQAFEGVGPWDPAGLVYYPPPWEALLNQPGMFADWSAELVDPDLAKFPVELAADGFERFGHDPTTQFVWVKYGQVSTLIHTGRVHPAEDIAGRPGGLGGGMLSYLYGQDSGAVSMSRRRGLQNGASNPVELYDNLAEWWQWSAHMVWLHEATTGHVIPSGRIVQPNTQVLTSGSPTSPSSVRVVSSGMMPMQTNPGGGNNPTTVLNMPVSFDREFTVTPAGLNVRTTLGATTDRFLDVVETIPLNGLSCSLWEARGGAWPAPQQVWFTTATGGSVQASLAGNVETYIDQVTEVYYLRGPGSMRVRFPTPQRVMLSAPYEQWSHDPQGSADCTGPASSWLVNQNVVIDLLGNARSGVPKPMSAGVSLSYDIQTQ